jgi:hypothetical protein
MVASCTSLHTRHLHVQMTCCDDIAPMWASGVSGLGSLDCGLEFHSRHRSIFAPFCPPPPDCEGKEALQLSDVNLRIVSQKEKTKNSVALSPQANYTD